VDKVRGCNSRHFTQTHPSSQPIKLLIKCSVKLNVISDHKILTGFTSIALRNHLATLNRTLYQNHIQSFQTPYITQHLTRTASTYILINTTPTAPTLYARPLFSHYQTVSASSQNSAHTLPDPCPLLIRTVATLPKPCPALTLLEPSLSLIKQRLALPKMCPKLTGSVP